MADIEFQFNLESDGLRLKIKGFNDSIPNFLNIIIRLLFEYNP